jgi:hypothetical protein
MVMKLYESVSFEIFYINCPCCDLIARKNRQLVLVEAKGTGHPYISVRQACVFIGNGKISLYNLVDVIDYYGLDCHDYSALFDDEELG